MNENVRFTLTKVCNSDQIRVEIRTDDERIKIDIDKITFADALFGLAEVPAVMQTQKFKNN